MADDKSGRDKQAHDEERRQRERDLAEELERGDELEPPVPADDLDEVETVGESVSFPATGAEVVAAAGQTEVELAAERYTVGELLPDTERVRFESTDSLRARLQRPTVARAMKRIVEAGDTIQNAEFSRSKREAYERTLRALAAKDETDEDEGLTVVTDWIVERIHETETLPKSRRVRNRGAKFCRENGYTVRDDEWLGA